MGFNSGFKVLIPFVPAPYRTKWHVSRGTLQIIKVAVFMINRNLFLTSTRIFFLDLFYIFQLKLN